MHHQSNERSVPKICGTGYQDSRSLCPTNNTCTWAHDGVCDDVKMNDDGVCAEGTDCEDCGTCNWYMCVSKKEVPKPTTMHKCESGTRVELPTPSPNVTSSPTGANICSSDSTCNVCDACCVNYFTVQAHCDGCVDSVC